MADERAPCQNDRACKGERALGRPCKGDLARFRSDKKPGISLAALLTPDERKERAVNAANARWAKRKDKLVSTSERPLPTAIYKGVLDLIGFEIPCYVLDNGQRVIGRTAYTEALTGIKGGGDLEKYLGVKKKKKKKKKKILT